MTDLEAIRHVLVTREEFRQHPPPYILEAKVDLEYGGRKWKCRSLSREKDTLMLSCMEENLWILMKQDRSEKAKAKDSK